MQRRIGWLVLVVGVLGLSFAAETGATPLYGGYNGESALWVEYQIGQVSNALVSTSIIFGSDDEDRAWTRVRISFVPLFTSLEYTRDYLDIQSVVFRTLFPWPFQVGTEIAGNGPDRPLWWFAAYILLGVGGIDSGGNGWAETGIPGIYGVGADVRGNQWFWFKIGNFLRGIGEDFPTEPARKVLDTGSSRGEELLFPLEDRFDELVGRPLLERLSSAQFMRAAEECSASLPQGGGYTPLSGILQAGPRGGSTGGGEMTGMQQPDGAACGSALALLVNGGIEKDLALLLDEFRAEVRPLLRERMSPH